MANTRVNYTINQDGETYFISSEIVGDKIKLICKGKNTPTSDTFEGLYSFPNLRNNYKEFSGCSNVKEAQELINNSIQQKRLIIEKNFNKLDLKLLILNNKISPYSYSPSNYNNFNANPVFINSPKKRIRREYLSLCLSPIENNNFNHPLNNNNDVPEIQFLTNSPLSTNRSSSNSSPINSPSSNGIQNPSNNQSFYDMTKLNDLENENIVMKNQINELNNQINELRLANQKYINDLQNLKAQSDSLLLNQQQEIENLKTINEQFLKENNDLKNILNEKNDPDSEVIKGDIIKSQNELEFLTQKIVRDYQNLNLDLIYKASVDGDKAEIFHSKCDQAENSLVLIETDKNARFGGFTSCSWSGNCEEKYDENAFVFSLNKLKIYDIIPGNNAIACYPNCGPVFLGCQIRIFDEAFTKGGSTFQKGKNYNTEEDFELTGGEENFKVKDIEVYSIELN